MVSDLEFLKVLADKTRLDILNILMNEDSYVEKLASDLSLTPATVCYHLKKMEHVGIVNCSRSQFYIIYSLNKELFDRPLSELIRRPPLTDSADADEKYKKEIISHFFKYGKLTQLPSQRKKREIILKEIAKSFSPDKEYSENEVNAVINRFWHDHCTVRREMISFGIMKRDNGIYTLITDQKS